MVDQRSMSSAVLLDPSTGKLVADGANIPMDQLLAGPRRAKLEFAPDLESEVRSLGQMLRREGGAPPEPIAGDLKGAAAGRKRGWTGLGRGSYVAYQVGVARGPRHKELLVGKVLRNLQDQQKVIVQPHVGLWVQVRVCHQPLYVGDKGQRTRTDTGSPIEELVNYQALVLTVELLIGGKLRYLSSRTLSDRGWGLRITSREEMQAEEEGTLPGECCGAIGEGNGATDDVFLQLRDASEEWLAAEESIEAGRCLTPGRAVSEAERVQRLAESSAAVSGAVVLRGSSLLRMLAGSRAACLHCARCGAVFSEGPLGDGLDAVSERLKAWTREPYGYVNDDLLSAAEWIHVDFSGCDAESGPLALRLVTRAAFAGVSLVTASVPLSVDAVPRVGLPYSMMAGGETLHASGPVFLAFGADGESRPESKSKDVWDRVAALRRAEGKLLRVLLPDGGSEVSDTVGVLLPWDRRLESSGGEASAAEPPSVACEAAGLAKEPKEHSICTGAELTQPAPAVSREATFDERRAAAARQWMERLAAGDLAGPELPPERYLQRACGRESADDGRLSEGGRL